MARQTTAGLAWEGTPVRELVQAVLDEVCGRVRELLTERPGLPREPGGWEALAVAARKGRCAIAALLLDAGADPNAAGFYGPKSAHSNLERPLHWAAGHGQRAMVELLLNRGADVEGGLRGLTPLQSAARAGNRAICDVLLARGARLNVFVLAALGRSEQLGDLLDRDPVEVNARDEYGTPPLHIAAELWREQMVRLLLARGADVRLADRHDDTVLHLVALRRFDPALWWGAFQGPGEAPADEAPNCDERAQLATAARLVEAGAEVNARNWRRVTPLHRAVRAGRIGFVRFLLDHGADVDAADVAGDTPLRRAVTRPERLPIAELLLQRGADASVTPKNGKPLAQLARGEEMKSLLRRRGAR